MPVYDSDQLQIYTRVSWADAWQLRTDLQPERGSISAGNENQSGSFTFTRIYGDTKYPAESSYQNRDVIDLDNQWIKVLHPPFGPADILWQGRIIAEPRKIHGNPGAIPSGIQTFAAYDGHTVLQRMEFYGSTGIARDHGTGTDKHVYVDYVLPFNDYIGNRSEGRHTDPSSGLDSYVFDVDEYDHTIPKRWSGEDVIEYLLATRINNPAAGMPLWVATNTALLSNIEDRYEFDSPVFNILDALKVVINRSYGVGFVVLPTQTGFEIRLFGLLPDPVNYGAATVPANTNVQTIDVNSSILDLGPVVERSFADQYPEIVVMGNRATICASFPRSDLAPAWYSGHETEYLAPISGSGPFSPEQLDKARQAEKFRYVYQAFYVDPETVQLPTPKVNEDGTIDDTAYTPVPRWGRETLPWIPIYEDKDYTVNPPIYRPQMQSHELMPPQVWMKDADGKYVGVDSAGVHLEVLPNQLGFRLNAPIPHYVANGDFAPDGIYQGTKTPPALQPDAMQCTLAWQYDYRQMMKRTLPGGNRLDGRKVIHVDADFWMIAPNTVIDVDYDGNLIRTPNEWMIVLDEKSKLEYIMAGAIGRYTLPRQRLTSRQQGLAYRQQWLGSIIQVINDGTNAAQIRGPLTSINWVFGPNQLTVLKTGYGELNPGELSPQVVSLAMSVEAAAAAKKAKP